MPSPSEPMPYPSFSQNETSFLDFVIIYISPLKLLFCNIRVYTIRRHRADVD